MSLNMKFARLLRTLEAVLDAPPKSALRRQAKAEARMLWAMLSTENPVSKVLEGGQFTEAQVEYIRGHHWQWLADIGLTLPWP